jgi:hypothetical protein
VSEAEASSLRLLILETDIFCLLRAQGEGGHGGGLTVAELGDVYDKIISTEALPGKVVLNATVVNGGLHNETGVELRLMRAQC